MPHLVTARLTRRRQSLQVDQSITTAEISRREDT
jgi:hypothetical protein